VFRELVRRQRERVNLLTEASMLEKAAKQLAKDLRGKIKAAAPVRKALTQALSIVENNAVAVTKGVVAAAGAPGSDRALNIDNSPGVALQAAMMKSTSELRLTLLATHEALESQLKRPSITLQDASEILDDYQAGASVDLLYIREGTQLAVEAILWAKLLLDNITLIARSGSYTTAQ
jgi:hypothetical protein